MMTEEKALSLLESLIAKPEVKAEEIAPLWNSLLSLYKQHFGAPVEVPVKKRRRKRVVGPMMGWPAGVTRAEYRLWKQAQEEAGVTTGLNPQAYKAQRDA